MSVQELHKLSDHLGFPRLDVRYQTPGHFAKICAVPPAELESVLLQHPDIADVGVVGVQSDAEATELPRYVIDQTPGLSHVHVRTCNRAYVVRKPGVQGDDIKAWTDSVHAWIKERVARHKYLRGGMDAPYAVHRMLIVGYF